MYITSFSDTNTTTVLMGSQEMDVVTKVDSVC